MKAAAATSPESPEYTVEAAPAWVTNRPLPPPGDVSSDSDREQLLRDFEISLAGSDPVVYYRAATVVRSASATADIASLTIGFDPSYQSISLHHARVTRDGIETDRLGSARVEVLRREDSLESQLITGRKSLHVLLDDIRVGDTVDVAYSTTGANPALQGRFGGYYAIDYSEPLRSRQIRLLYPQERQIVARLRSYSDAGTAAVRHRREAAADLIEERWEADNLPARIDDGQIPGSYIEGVWVEIKDPASWGDIVDWAIPMFQFDSDPGVRQQAEDLSAGSETLEDSVLSAIRFVQDDIRYTGLEFGENAFRPHAPNVVLEQRFGDCKDKAALLVALLGEMGVSASPALVSSWRGSRLHDELPSSNTFDHVIVRVAWGDQTIWIDPTSTFERGRLATHTQSQLGAALPIAQGVDALSEIPAVIPKKPLIDVHEKMSVIEQGKVSEDPIRYDITTVYRGSQADATRRYFAANGAEVVGQTYVESMSSHYPAIELAQRPTISDDVDLNEVTVVEHYRLPEFWVEDADDPGVRTASIWSTEIDRNLPGPKHGSRGSPLALLHPMWVRQQLDAPLGGTWTPSRSNELVDNHYASFNSRFILSARKLKLTASYRSHAAEVPASDYPVFRRDMQRANESVGYTLTTGASSSEDSLFPDIQWSHWIDWRLSVLLLAVLLPWLWPVVGALSKSRSPWLGMFTRPRACMREIDGKGSNAMIFVLLWLAVMDSLVWDDSFLNKIGGVDNSVMLFGLLWLAVRSAGGIPVRLLFMAILASIGRRLGGIASNRQVITATAWAGVPSLAGLPAGFLALMLYGANAMTLESMDGDAFGGTIILWMVLLLTLPFSLWSLVVWVVALAEVQRFSIGRSLASIGILMALLLAILVAVVALFGLPASWTGGSGA